MAVGTAAARGAARAVSAAVPVPVGRLPFQPPGRALVPRYVVAASFTRRRGALARGLCRPAAIANGRAAGRPVRPRSPLRRC